MARWSLNYAVLGDRGTHKLIRYLDRKAPSSTSLVPYQHAWSKVLLFHTGEVYVTVSDMYTIKAAEDPF